MRVAVVTTSYDEPAEQLARCVESVRGQNYRGEVFQIVVRDRAGAGDVPG